jgi:hypothetical protein
MLMLDQRNVESARHLKWLSSAEDALLPRINASGRGGSMDC